MEAAMTALLDPRDAERLAKLCGMFGSDHDGERASAAAMADEIVRAHGLTWRDVISTSATRSCGMDDIAPAPTDSVETQIEFCLQHEDLLNSWEWGFLNGIRGRQFLTDKQLAKLGTIVAKVKADAEAA
jgi:hypothetical protein